MKHKKGTVLIILGLLLIASAAALVVYNIRETERAAQTSAAVVEQLVAVIPTLPTETEPNPDFVPQETVAQNPSEVEIPDYILNPGMEMPTETVDGQDYIGILEIPAFDLVLPVISTWSYPSFQSAPCRYTGSAYQDNLIIAAHNYSSHFGNLQALSVGDPIRFTDVDGHVFAYEVVEMEILDPTAAEEMEAGDWDLTMFTCTVGGASRVTVRCVRCE